MDEAQVQRMEELEAQAQTRDDEMRELRSRLALSRAETEDLRSSPAASVRSETVRIRAESGANDLRFFEDEEGGSWETPAENLPEPTRAREPRPVLRLYGSPAATLPEAMLRSPELPAASIPPGLPRVLPLSPVAAMPMPSTQMPMAMSPVGVQPSPNPNPNRADVLFQRQMAPQPRVDAGVADYRAALGQLRQRQYDQALAGFDRFLTRHARHRMAAPASYWRAEVLYIQRRYGDAMAAFQTYLDRFGRSDRAPDALLKISYCRRRMGDRAGAQQALARLRRDYPTSVAARTATHEDAS